MNGRPGAPLTEPRWLPLAAGLFLAAAVVAAYANSLFAPFVFDDGPSIVDNPTIRQLWPLGPAFSPPAGGLTVSGRPVLNLSLAMNYAISGTSVWSYHAANLAIHLLAALTLFGIVRRTPPRSAALAFGAALLWAVHPLQTEAVVYVVQRAESLMGLFYLLTLYGFIRGSEAAAGPAAWGWFGLSWLACLLGMGTKEVMVSAPVLVFLYDRTFLAGSFREAWRRHRRVHLALAATWIPLALLVASTGGDRGGTSGFDVGVGWWAYGLTQFQALVRYLELAVWPHPLVFEYGPFWVQRALAVIPDALVVTALAAATLWALRRRPVLGFLGFSFFAILAPTSLVPGTLQMIVEHRMYLPLAALAVAAAAVLRARLGARASLIVVLALAGGLGAATVRRNATYRTEFRLWSDTVAKRPDNPFALYGLGIVLAREGRSAEAMADYERAIRFRPGYADAHLNLGNLLYQAGRLPEAIVEFQAAVRLRPDSARAHNNYGNALAGVGWTQAAIGQFQEALWLQPNYPEAEYNFAAVLAAGGRLPEAAEHYRKALLFNPDYAEAHANLGVILAQTGHLDEAIEQFRETLRLKPDYPEELDNLGNALAQKGHFLEAKEQYEKAVTLRPSYAEAHSGLGNALAGLGRYAEAEAQFQEALQARSDYPQARNNLARVQALERGAEAK